MSLQLTPSRPLRSEAEKERRISSRWSGQSQHYLRNVNNGVDSPEFKGNRDSIGTTDSTASEDDPPPPLPVKSREADYCNLPSDVLSVDSCPTSPTNSITNLTSPKLKCKLPAPLDSGDDSVKPPPPPPKPKRPPPHNLTKISIPLNDTPDPAQDSSAA